MVKVAEEAWIATALLHREQPDRLAFRNAEILARVRQEALSSHVRPGIDTHVSVDAVANKRPNPGRHRYLYATGHGERRLFRSGDDFHPDRVGPTVPDAADLPREYQHLLDWYHGVYDLSSGSRREVREAAAEFALETESAVAFERSVRVAISRHFGVSVEARAVSAVPKTFGFVADDGSVVGDAKFFALVGGRRLPPAKFSIIAEYVWLLEKTGAPNKVLVFGNDRRVPEEWLRRYGHLATDVQFFFLDADGELHELPERVSDEGPWNPLSSSSFARDWNSEEDAIYDALPPG